MKSSFEQSTIALSLLMILGSGYGFYQNLQPQQENELRSLTSAVGHASLAKNSIKTKPAKGFSWSSLETGGSLYHKDVVFVAEDSQLTITLNDQTELHLGPNTLMVLDTGEKDPTSAFAVTEIKLLRGDIEIDQEKVKTPDTARQLQLTMDNKTSLKIEKKSQIAVKKRAGTASLVVKSGDVAVSYAGKTARKEIARLNKPSVVEEIKLDDLEKELTLEQKDLTEDQLKGRKLASVLPETSKTEAASAESFSDMGDLSSLKVSSLEGNSPPTSPAQVEPLKVEPTPPPEPVKVAAVEPVKVPKPKPVDRIFDSAPNYNKRFNALALKGKVSKMVDSDFVLEVSYHPDFASKILRIDVSDQIRDQEDFTVRLHPKYLLANGPLLKSIYTNPKLYWRLVDLNSQKVPKSAAINFRFNPKADIKLQPPTPQSGGLKLNWVLKDTLPGKYQIEVAQDPAFKKIVCTKTQTRFAVPDKSSEEEFEGEKTVILEFKESASIASSDCSSALVPNKPYHTRVITFDPAGRRMPYVKQKASVATFKAQ